MSDEVWRRGREDDPDDGDDGGEFGPPLFGSDSSSGKTTRGGLSFGSSDTGPLPHWSEPATGEMPSTLSAPSASSASSAPDPTGDLDVWSTFSDAAPVWSDDAPSPATGEFDTIGAALFSDESFDQSAPVPRREPGRITIGTDPTDDRLGRPVPKGRGRSSGDMSRNARLTVPPRTGAGSASAVRASGRDMPTAIAVGVIIAAVFIGALLLKPVAALVVIVAVIGLASVEFFDKVTEKGYRPATVTGIVACVAAPIATYWMGETAIPLIMVLALAAGCATFISSSGIESNPMPNMAITTLGVTWIGITGSFAAIILSASNTSLHSLGTDTLFLLALCVVANDVGALFIGSAAGRTPLRQWISPNKTLEGFIGGTIMTVLAMVVVGVSGRSDTWHSTKDLILLAIVVAVTAPLGDLTESMFKRNLEVKDFGSIVKGHGGVLDRFDGFLFTLPAVYYLMIIIQPWANR
jgi:phosphatidate cytidylyltransferase